MPKTTKQFLALLRNGNIGIPLVILCILAMVILPLPPALLDILFTFNIVLAVMVLLLDPERGVNTRGVTAWAYGRRRCR